MLLSQFCIVFDGWTDADNHYVGVYASFPEDSSQGYKLVLLAFSLLEEETIQNTDNLYEFFYFVLDLFNATAENVVALVDDNCSTNKLLSRKLGINLVSCVSHRYALAMKDLLVLYKSVHDKVQKVMAHFRYLIPSARLKKFTPLKLKIRNCTRWSLSIDILKR